MDEVMTIDAYQRYFELYVDIIDDCQWEPDETFFLKISVLEGQSFAKVGHRPICIVTIIDDDGFLFNYLIQNRF